MCLDKMPRGKAAGSGGSSITSHDIARLVGVSQSTVSRALRGDPSVAPATRERVLEAARESRYVPNEIGRSLSTRLTRRIGMVVTDVGNPFYPYLVGPLHDTLDELGYRMVLFAERGEAEALTDRLAGQSIDGVVLTTAMLNSSLARDLHARGVPLVYLNRVAEGVPADSVVVDNALGASLVAAELVRLGHRHIGALFGPTETSTGRDRERGFRVALVSAGIELAEEDVRHGDYHFDTGHEEMLDLMQDRSVRPTAVFCGNDAIAIGALNAARRLQLRVPEDVSIVGFDDFPMADWELMKLTSVHTPSSEMAELAARLLVERIEALPASLEPRNHVFAPRLVIRATTGPVTVSE